jgi:hypothetical protein
MKQCQEMTSYQWVEIPEEKVSLFYTGFKSGTKIELATFFAPVEGSTSAELCLNISSSNHNLEPVFLDFEDCIDIERLSGEWVVNLKELLVSRNQTEYLDQCISEAIVDKIKLVIKYDTEFDLAEGTGFHSLPEGKTFGVWLEYGAFITESFFDAGLLSQFFEFRDEPTEQELDIASEKSLEEQQKYYSSN